MTHLYRVRTDSDLADRIAGYKEDGHSLTQLISELLAAHFNTALPMKLYTERTILYMAPKGVEDIELNHIMRTASANDCHKCHRPFDEAGEQKYRLPGGDELRLKRKT